MLLNHNVTKKSELTYDILKSEIAPAITTLNQFKAYNNELLLLSFNKIADKNSIKNTNRMKQISEVELPYLKIKLNELKNISNKNNSKIALIDQLNKYTDSTLLINKTIYNLLQTSKDYTTPSKINKARELSNLKLSDLSFAIENIIVNLQVAYNKEYEDYQSELSLQLHNISNFILITSLIGILLGIAVAFFTINSIIKPIKDLETSALKVSEGDYNAIVHVKGKNELTSLANSFNIMIGKLKQSFNEINSKNKEIENFVYIASHDLQEPLRTINSFSALLEEQNSEQLDDEAKQYLKFISEAGMRMKDLVVGLMDYGRLGRLGELKALNCNTIVEQVKNDLDNVISKNNATIVIGPLPTLNGYETELRLLFQNLISNAIKFQKPNALVRIKITAEEEANFWKFAVEDNGIGIKEAHLEKIFSIFQRLHTREEYEGTGIGLAHCKKIVEIHKGQIWVKSVYNEGSTFYFTISK
tara:strand:- start:58585 stop:60006 length:1422 start_codon:yes stop_codon:yes gene_type:complete